MPGTKKLEIEVKYENPVTLFRKESADPATKTEILPVALVTYHAAEIQNIPFIVGPQTYASDFGNNETETLHRRYIHRAVRSLGRMLKEPLE
jgi:hypothetical protein